MDPAGFDLALIFQTAASVLSQQREAFNQADELNGNHGDHMVAIFRVATQAVSEVPLDDLAESMEYAAAQLRELKDNASASIYAIGLQQLAKELRANGIQLADLVPYVAHAVREKDAAGERANTAKEPQVKSTLVLKAFVNGLAGWKHALAEDASSDKRLDLSYMFDLGIAYMQAKQQGGSRIQVLAETAVNVSPLASPAYRAQSGMQAIQAILQAIADQAAPYIDPAAG